MGGWGPVGRNRTAIDGTFIPAVFFVPSVSFVSLWSERID
jgi:hypothetical protein